MKNDSNAEIFLLDIFESVDSFKQSESVITIIAKLQKVKIFDM